MPLIQTTNKLAILMVIAACSVVLQGQTKTSVPKPPANWSLTLKTGGAPWEKKFVVELNQSGSLVVNEEDPAKMPADPKSKRTVNLTPAQAQQIYEQALKAFREFRFEGEEGRRDGTNLTLQLSANGKLLEMQLFHISPIDDEIVEINALLSLINKHLPPEHHVY